MAEAVSAEAVSAEADYISVGLFLWLQVELNIMEKWF